MTQTVVVEERPYKGWTITIRKKRSNNIRPFIVLIVAPDGKQRHVARTQPDQTSLIHKEVTYSTIIAARHAGFTAVNHHESQNKGPQDLQSSSEQLTEQLLSAYGKTY